MKNNEIEEKMKVGRKKEVEEINLLLSKLNSSLIVEESPYSVGNPEKDISIAIAGAMTNPILQDLSDIIMHIIYLHLTKKAKKLGFNTILAWVKNVGSNELIVERDTITKKIKSKLNENF